MNKPTATVSSPSTQYSDDDNNIVVLLGLLLSNWKIILTFALLGLLLGFTYSRYIQQPTYQTDALVKINDTSKSIAALGTNISDLVGYETSPVEDERVLIKSRLVLEPVVKNLNLDIRLNNPEIGAIERIKTSRLPTQISTPQSVSLDTENGLAEISRFEVPATYLDHPFTLIKTVSGYQLSLDSMPELVNFTGNLGKPTTFHLPDGDIHLSVDQLPGNEQPVSLTKLTIPAAIDLINNSLTVQQEGEQTGFIELILTGPDQQQITQVLNNIVQEYVSQQQDLSTEETTTIINFMESQIPELKQKLEQSEEAFNIFREQHGTIDVSKEGELLLNENSNIASQFSDLNLKKAELLTYYTAQHPMVIQINDQLASISSRRNQIARMIETLPSTQREFLKLSEDMGINREIYLTMLKNYQQLKIARAGQTSYVQLIDPPISTFRKIASKSPKILASTLILGIFLGAITVFVRSILRKTIKQPEDLELKTGIPVIAAIPRSRKAHRLVNKKAPGESLLTVVDHNSSSYEGIKSLRTALLLNKPCISKLSNSNPQRAKIFVVTGESPNTGKSFICANLAEAFGHLDKKVLVIDGDMRLGEQHHTFPVRDQTGLADYLSDSKTSPSTNSNTDSTPTTPESPPLSTVSNLPSKLTPFIQPTSFDNIDLMPRGNQPNNPSSLLSSDRYQQLITELTNYYDYILIDTPPVLAASDAILMAQYADQVLLVSRYDQSIEGQTIQAIKQLEKAQVNVSGIVINDMTKRVMDKYSSHYYYSYNPSSVK